MHSKQHDFTRLKPLLNLARLVGQFNGRTRYRRPYECYALVFLVGTIAAFASVTIKKFRDDYLTQTTAFVVDLLKTAVSTGLSLVAILGNSWLHAGKIRSLLTKFGRVDWLLKLRSERNVARSLIMKLIGFHAAYLAMVSYNVFFLARRNDSDAIYYYALDIWQNYSGFVSTVLICNLLRCIRRGFVDLNFLLVTKVDGNLECGALIDCYTILTEIVDLFNEAFGWQILLIFVNTLLMLLTPINAIIILIPKSVEGRNEFSFGSDIFASTLLTVMSFAGGVTIAKYAHHAHREARRTAFLCFKLLQEMPIALSGQQRVVRKKLTVLAKETSTRCPHFSAAGFFVVDYTMLFTLLTSITTYLVVLIQLNR